MRVWIQQNEPKWLCRREPRISTYYKGIRGNIEGFIRDDGEEKREKYEFLLFYFLNNLTTILYKIK